MPTTTSKIDSQGVFNKRFQGTVISFLSTDAIHVIIQIFFILIYGHRHNLHYSNINQFKNECVFVYVWLRVHCVHL